MIIITAPTYFYTFFFFFRELTLFWSKLQQRVESSVQVYLERCRQLSLLTKTVYHIFFLIKVINSEVRIIKTSFLSLKYINYL